MSVVILNQCKVLYGASTTMNAHYHTGCISGQLQLIIQRITVAQSELGLTLNFLT